jgi:RNA polymerase sigma-70 factor (ECF subfamily)
MYQDHYRAVFAYVLVRTRHREDAEDITNETFARAFLAWDSLRSYDSALPWLLLTARRLTTDRWRRARRYVLERLNPTSTGPVDPATLEGSVMGWLDSVDEVLSRRQLEAIALRYQRDLTDNDIAEVMGLTPSGVRSLIARGIAKLREHPEVW